MDKLDVIAWLVSLPDGVQIGIDDGGLTLQTFGDYKGPTFYLEIGGIPEDDS